MKIQCQLCKEIVPIGSFRASAAGIDVTCGACGESFFVPSTPETDTGEGSGETRRGEEAAGEAPPAASPQRAVVEMRCPKCGELQPRADACRACGLRVEFFEEYARERDEEAPEELEALWAQCEADWGDEDAHERFSKCASAAYAFAYAARRYRDVLRQRPDDEVAHRQLDRLSRMAEASLMSSSLARQAADEGKQPYKSVIIMLIVLVLLAGIGGIYAMIKQAGDVGSETEQKTPPTQPAKRR